MVLNSLPPIVAAAHLVSGKISKQEYIETMKELRYIEVKYLMQQLLSVKTIKTAAVLGNIDENGYFSMTSIVGVTANSPLNRHAEDLLLTNYVLDDNIPKFIMISRIPCETCMRMILTEFPWWRLTLVIPAVLNVKSKWLKTQVKALAFLNEYNDMHKTSESKQIEVICYD